MRGALAAALALAIAAPGVAQADALGQWQVPGGSITVEISHCGANLCGVLLSSPRIRADPNVKDEKNKNAALRGRLLRGIQMLQGFAGGPSQWSGKIYLPGNGETYPATLKQDDANTISLKVCPMGPLCKTQALKRVK